MLIQDLQIVSVFVLLSCAMLCCDSGRIFKATYIHSEDVINVKIFENEFHHSYKVKLFASDFAKSCSNHSGHTIYQNIHDSNNDFSISGPYLNGYYCILVTPVNISSSSPCQSQCETAFQRVFINTIDCCNWTAKFKMDKETKDDGTHKLIVKLNMKDPFQSCFSTINISLWHDAYKVCDGLSGLELKQVTVNVVPKNWTISSFDHLNPGNYCVRVSIYHPSCEGPSSVKYSEVETLTNPTPETRSALESPSNRNSTGMSWLTAIIVCVVLVACAMLGIFFYKKYKFSHSKTDIGFSSKDLNLKDIVAMAEARARNLEVVVLYSRDFKEHIGMVEALYKFIMDNFGLHSVRFDEYEEADICVNLNTWVEGVVMPKSNRRILIVESEGAVLQEEGKKKNKLIRPADEDFMDDIFPYALELLKNESLGLLDYGTVFVVNFGNVPPPHLNFCVPNRRYKLPQHLFDLYCALLDLPKPSPSVMNCFEANMNRKWEGPLRKDLHHKIKSVCEALKTNPDLVSKSFQERNLFE